jgi:hypothetical protein
MEHLIASHVQPWRDSSNEQRLDGENGLLLTPTVDHLFDKGFISFEDSGQLIVSPVADQRSLKRMGVDPESRVNEGYFNALVRMFEQALKVIGTLPENDRLELFARLDAVRRTSHNVGYGVGDDMDDLLAEHAIDGGQ